LDTTIEKRAPSLTPVISSKCEEQRHEREHPAIYPAEHGGHLPPNRCGTWPGRRRCCPSVKEGGFGGRHQRFSLPATMKRFCLRRRLLHARRGFNSASIELHDSRVRSTRRWSEADSNHRSPLKSEVFRDHADS